MVGVVAANEAICNLTVHEVWKRPQPVLTHDEEQVLEDWLVEMASIGYGRTKQQLQHSVKEILQKEGRQKDNLPGRKWVYALFRSQ